MDPERKAGWSLHRPFKSAAIGSKPTGSSMFKSPAIHRTPLYRARSAYRDMKRRCGNANGKNPAYAGVELRMTMDEWLAWAVPEYGRFNQDHPNESPNASRRGDAGHYEIGNIEVIPRKDNLAEQKHPINATHGMYAMYRHHKCRCTACRAANARHRERYRTRSLIGRATVS